ncbi:MAG: hypothetical protein IJP78_07880 [Clostridia bacterium]|nr:hypothetical protein [Clostridia bacterium]
MARYIIDNQPQEINFEIGGEIIPRTVQNAKNLLMIQMGEVPYDRFRGFDPAVYHLPIDKLRMALLPELDRVMLWEPDAEVVEATAEVNKDGEIVITATLDIGIEE